MSARKMVLMLALPYVNVLVLVAIAIYVGQ